MKLRTCFLTGLLGLFSTVHAANQHVHPNQSTQAAGASSNPSESSVQWAGSCEIEILNRSAVDVHVTGIFDDGVPLEPFNVYHFDAPHYISLYYDGYCHRGMELALDTFAGRPLFSGYVRGGTTLEISYKLNQVTASLRAS